jgi:adenylate cyclase, class 2
VSIETEVKIRLDDPDDLRRHLSAVKAARVSDRHFEDNYVLDFRDGHLGAQQCLLRVRYTSRVALVTFKGRPQAGSTFKVREELECGVENASVVLAIFERLGLEVRFRYQKYREEYHVGVGAGLVHVAVDDTPIGAFAELEGLPDAIRGVAAAVGFSEAQFLPESYYTLYIRFCRGRGESPGNMIFPGAQPGQ